MTIYEILLAILMVAFLGFGLKLRNKMHSSQLNTQFTDKDQFMLEIIQEIEKDQSQLVKQLPKYQELNSQLEKFSNKINKIEQDQNQIKQQLSNIQELNAELEKVSNKIKRFETPVLHKEKLNLNSHKINRPLYDFESLGIEVKATSSFSKTNKIDEVIDDIFIDFYTKTPTKTKTNNIDRKVIQSSGILA
ncbi:hypothetical protein P4K82_04585 [Bacillus cereus]|nr:hypothetical protein [Bacillus cereus]